MPRPRKWRKVCCLPDTDKFGPIDENVHNDKVIYLTVDEYETMRLIDLERFIIYCIGGQRLYTYSITSTSSY